MYLDYLENWHFRFKRFIISKGLKFISKPELNYRPVVYGIEM
jgi:hypothetical protein